MKENSFAESLGKVLEKSAPLDREEIRFHEALGRVLAEDIEVGEDDPPTPKSRMDGFALRASETSGATPENLLKFSYQEVVGAGHLSKTPLSPGKAIRLMTGAWLPEGADAIVKLEDTQPSGQGAFTLQHPLQSGENVIPAGTFLKKGEKPLMAGSVVTPQAWGMLASLGKSRLMVNRQPRVALLALGDELVEPGEKLAPGQLYVSNIYTLQAKIFRYGGLPLSLGIAGDSLDLIQTLLAPCVLLPGEDPRPKGCEMIITVGGSHQGDFDFARPVLQELGAEIHFQQTKLNMGSSTIFASLGDTVFFGLPGTPSASNWVFEVLVRPALWRMAGRREIKPRLLEARLAAPFLAQKDRTCFIPGWLTFPPSGPPEVQPIINKGRGKSAGKNSPETPPGLLANCLIHVPEGGSHFSTGDSLPVEWLGD